MATVIVLYRKIFPHGKERFMRTRVFGPCCTVVFAALIVALCMAPEGRGQGGEPPYFAIRGAKIVTVSGRTAENSTIIISRGIITAIAADAKIPDEAWIIDGKGLTAFPGLIDSYTDVGLVAPATPGTPATPGAPAMTEAAQRPAQTQIPARGPEDLPGTTPWRN